MPITKMWRLQFKKAYLQGTAIKLAKSFSRFFIEKLAFPQQ